MKSIRYWHFPAALKHFPVRVQRRVNGVMLMPNWRIGSDKNKTGYWDMKSMEHTASRRPLRRTLPLIVIGLGAVIGLWQFGDVLTFESLRDNREALIAWRDQNYGTAIVVYMAVYAGVVAFSLPGGLAMTLAGGFLFGTVAGAAMTVVAATAGATLIYLAARIGLGDQLHAMLTRRSGTGALRKMESGLRTNEISYLFLMRLVPAVPFFVANLAPAFLGVGVRNYVLTTFVGIIPGTLVYSWIGSGLGEVFARGETPDLGVIFEPEILGPILGLAALAALPIVLNIIRSRKESS